jgi:hypothetical protein
MKERQPCYLHTKIKSIRLIRFRRHSWQIGRFSPRFSDALPEGMELLSSSVCAATQQSVQIRSTDDYQFKGCIDEVTSRLRKKSVTNYLTYFGSHPPPLGCFDSGFTSFPFYSHTARYKPSPGEPGRMQSHASSSRGGCCKST